MDISNTKKCLFKTGAKVLLFWYFCTGIPYMNKVRTRDNFDFLTTAPVSRVVLSLALPSILSMLVTSVYNMVDTFFVGRISTQATAAVGVVFPVMSIVQACGFYFGQGSGSFISRVLGARQKESASKMASTAFFSSFLFGVLIMVAGLITLEPLSVALGSTPTILPYTKTFLRIILFGVPFMTASMTLNNQIRFQGNARYGMLGIIAGAVLNVGLVPLFIFVFDMGIAGAALGTIIGQITSFVVLVVMTFYGGNLPLKFSNISFKGQYQKEIFKGGTPSLTRQGLASISTLLLNLSAGMYGDAAIAGMSIVTRITFVIFSIVLGLGQGFQPLCGFNYGAGLFERVRKGFWFCINAGLVFLVPVCVSCFIFSADIVEAMRHDAEVVQVGSAALRWQILTFPAALFIIMTNMMLQTSGHSLEANILAACRNGICFIPVIVILPKICGLLGVEMSQMIADLLSFAVAVPLTVRYFRKLSLKR